ncbi:hypothetical protein C8R42DRAFT_718938 [Lentinula raphanica]|nr:hypothetical protein C8R42DRAFT_718938 [Lentinula raphanica]
MASSSSKGKSSKKHQGTTVQRLKLSDIIPSQRSHTHIRSETLNASGQVVQTQIPAEIPAPLLKKRRIIATGNPASEQRLNDLLQFALVNGEHIPTVEVEDFTKLTPEALDHHLNDFKKRQRRYAVSKWNGRYFERVWLQQLGISVHFGHAYESICPNPRIVKEFTVIHTNGIHRITAVFCNCENVNVAGEWRQQLLRRRWFPATHIQPETAATFEVLNQFHVLTLQGKVTTYDFYAGLEKLYDNVGTARKIDRYKAFSQMIREWRNLKMLKRGGRGNDATRTPGDTQLGELAVNCIACPRPEENLPNGWENEPAETRFKYWLYLAEDACFRLKRRLVSSIEADPGIGTGSSYFVEDTAFREYIAGCGAQNEMNTCTGLSAVDHANTKFSRGYATTGVGLAVCARHELVQKNGVVDLQKGERYCNMDYAFGSILRGIDPRITIVQSYDIACQWSKNLYERMRELPSQVAASLSERRIYFAIPKLHIHGHNLSCQLSFSLNWLWGAGRTDGEGVERNWAHMGPVATSTRDMGPGNRHEVLDDHFGHWNWRGICRLGELLQKRYDNALEERDVHNKALEQFRAERPDDIEEWETMITTWESELIKAPKDRKADNPYESLKTGLSEHQVRLAIAKDEALEVAAGSVNLHDVGPSAFISQMIDVQDSMRSVKMELGSRKSMTALQQTDAIQRRTKLIRAVGKIRSLQAVYIPAAIQRLSNSESEVEINAEDIELIFPSDLLESERATGCRAGLLEVERKLCESQLSTSLDKLRNNLHIKSRLLTYRTTNVVHQARVTKSQALMARTQRQIDLYTNRYRTAWHALAKIVGGTEHMAWHYLNDKDVCMMREEPPLGNVRKRIGNRRREEERVQQQQEWEIEQQHVNAQLRELEGTEQGRQMSELQRLRAACGEGKRRVSWIWMACGNGELQDEGVLEDGIRVEYCKAHARAKRWQEEVILIEEEMRRCLVSLEARAQVWDNRMAFAGPQAEETDEIQKEGIRAYAASQADVYRRLKNRFVGLWESGARKRAIERAAALENRDEGNNTDAFMDEGNAQADDEEEEEKEEEEFDEDIPAIDELD